MKFNQGIIIGIKQPYLKVGYDGMLILRNDNPKNLIIKATHDLKMLSECNFELYCDKRQMRDAYLDSAMLEQSGINFMCNDQYQNALECFKK
jgi:hypothetical protein